MRKILISFISIFTLFLGFSTTFSAYDGESVFKIYNYDYDIENEIYGITGYGSAVYLGNNKILTNAHVILGDNNLPTGNYEICETLDFKSSPKCFTLGKLLYYDEGKDLALLEINKTPINNNGVKLSKNDISIGNNIITYGYPSNGGETITSTSGKISGFNSGFYKIDASIDSGSSGGGAFDINGNLVGITTFVVDGYTTLGYLISVEDINDFLDNKGEIVKYDKLDNSFISFLNKYHTSLYSNNINNDYVKFNNFNKYGFEIYENTFDKSLSINNYELRTIRGDTLITIGRKIFNSINNDSFNIENQIHILKESGITNYTNSYINIGGSKYEYSLNYDKKSKDINIIFENINGNYFSIYGNMNYKEEIKNALLFFMNEVKFKGFTKIDKYINTNGVYFSDVENYYITKLNNDGQFKILGNSKNKDIILNMLLFSYVYSDYENDTSLADTIKSLTESNNENKDTEFNTLIDNNGNVLFVTYLDNSYTVEVLFELNDKLYSHNFIIKPYGKGDINNDIKNLLNNINYNGKSYFSYNEINDLNIQSINNFNFKNNFERNKSSYLLDNSIEDSIKLLEDILGLKYNGGFNLLNNNVNPSNSNNSNNNSNNSNNITENNNLNYSKKILTKNLILIKLKLKNTKWNKYVTKFNDIIPKLTDEKLLSINKKIQNIDLNNSKIAKFKDILTYLKLKIELEILDRE